MRVLIACEFSGIVRDAFLAKGHDAMSCDLLPTESPGPHYQGDVFDIIGDGWDMMIAHPPCTHLALSGAAWFEGKRKDGRQAEAISLFMRMANAPIPRIAIENPANIMGRIWRKRDQVIQPYRFGDPYQKTTWLWLKGLPKLKATHSEAPLFSETLDKGEMVTFASGRRMPKWYAESRGDGHLRSMTFPGIARAMADQWG